MSKAFEDKVIDEFSALEKSNFHILRSEHRIFLCGGLVDAKENCPQSFRDRLLRYTASKSDLTSLHDSLVLAEEFKDYFQDSLYPDLLQFEDDIASISSLIVIFLESPGSLVELGLFCSRPDYYKKLLIAAPSDKTASEDSFIYLGPLTYIAKQQPHSVLYYPWPKPSDSYDSTNLEDLSSCIADKLKNIPSKSAFSLETPGHLAFLICEIINLTHPVLLGEIELALEALDINTTEKVVTRYLYLLQKMKFIGKLTYSSYSFYYPLNPGNQKITLGKAKNGSFTDRQKIIMSIRQAFVMSEDISDKRRKVALRHILEMRP